MKFTFLWSEDVDRGVVLFNINTLYMVSSMLKRFKLREIDTRTKLLNDETHLPRVIKPFDDDFIHLVNESESNVPMLQNGHESLFKKFDEYFGPLVLVTATEAQQAQLKWNTVAPQFTEVLNSLFDKVETKVRQVDVYLTHYGHTGSYCYHKNTKTISVYWNIGAPVITVAYLIIQALVHVYNYKRWLYKEKEFVKTGLWHNKVAIATMLSNLPMMTRIFGTKVKTEWLYKEVTQDAQLLQKLQLESDTVRIELEDSVKINGIEIRGLTKSEDSLLRVLAEN